VSTFDVEIRKKIRDAQVGETFTVPVGHLSREVAGGRALKWAKSRKLYILLLDAPDGHITIKRVGQDEARPNRYPEMTKLAIGESHLYAVPYPMHQRVRMAASMINRNGEVLLSCSKETGGLRVTRHPLTPEEISQHGLIEAKPRQSKYGLERLATQRDLTFHPKTIEEVKNLRSAVTIKRQSTGWRLTCRAQPDGSMMVTRLDTDTTQEG